MVDYETGDAVARKMAQTLFDELLDAGHTEIDDEDVARIFGLSMAYVMSGDWAATSLMFAGMAKAASVTAAAQEAAQ